REKVPRVVDADARGAAVEQRRDRGRQVVAWPVGEPRLTGGAELAPSELVEHVGRPAVQVVEDSFEVPDMCGLDAREVVGAVPGVADLDARAGLWADVHCPPIAAARNPGREGPIPDPVLA